MKYGVLSKSLLAAAALVVLGGMAAAANADVISSASQTTFTSTIQVNLTNQGSVDWIDFSDQTGTTLGTPIAMAGGSGIGKVTFGSTGNGNKEITNFPSQFTWTNGPSGINGGNGTNNQGAYVLTSSPGTISFDVTGDGNAEALTVYTRVYNGSKTTPLSDPLSATFTLSSGGTGSPYTVTTASQGTYQGVGYIDTVNFQLAAGDTMNVVLTTPQNSSNIAIAAATLADASPVPEPASLGLMGIGGAALLLVGRRKRA
jgi:hypothetical protein